MKVDILFVGAHPDDDSTATATLARYALDGGRRVAVVTATRGEGGGNACGRESGAALGILREAEERAALGSLGIDLVYYLEREDFGFTTSCEATEERWGSRATLERLVRLVRVLRPDVIVTMNPVPRGHGNHQYIARLATEAYARAGDSTVFPEQIRVEHLTPWEPRKLYYALEYGAEGLQPTLLVSAQDRSPSRGRSYHELEDQALRRYRSQGWGVAPPHQPLSEPFVLAASRATRQTRETDMREGLEAPLALELVYGSGVAGQDAPLTLRVSNQGPPFSGAAHLVAPAGWQVEDPPAFSLRPGESRAVAFKVRPPASAPPGWVQLEARVGNGERVGELTTVGDFEVSRPVTATLEPIAAVQNFQRWASDLGLRHLIRLVPAQVAVGQGETAVVRTRVTNAGATSAAVRVSLNGGPAQASTLDPGKSVTLEQAVRGESLGSHPLVMLARLADGGELREEGSLAVVPTLRVPRLGQAPEIGRFGAWGGTPVAIPHDRLWEGHTSGPADLTTSFWVGYGQGFLYVRLMVEDDVVMAHLAANDNKAYWRTDSVEVAVDPAGPGASPHTLGTFRLGIVPFNSDGHPMASRSADANPGPAEETVPGTRLASRRTDRGYLLEAAIPLTVLRLQPGRPFGFNLMVYDADERSPRPGENYNKARTAWSAWETVQGTPRLWGHAVLEP